MLAGRCVRYPPHSTPLLLPDGIVLPNCPTAGLSATLTLPDYGRVARDRPQLPKNPGAICWEPTVEEDCTRWRRGQSPYSEWPLRDSYTIGITRYSSPTPTA